MTTYYFNEARNEILAAWPTGVGGRACAVVQLGPISADLAPGVSAGSALAMWLTGLSQAAWRTYTHGGAFVEPDEINSEAWRLQQDREAFEEVPLLISEPGNPNFVSYSPLRRNAEQIGHALRSFATPDLVSALRSEIETELAAVVMGELGNFSGRAAQAVVQSRPASSPTQVQAAWDVLAAGMLDATVQLQTTLDPTSASVAAAAWLRAAAEVTSAAMDSPMHWTEVVVEADNIEALPVETPTEVLEHLDMGLSPSEAVSFFVKDALRVANGELPDRDALFEKLTETAALAERYPGSSGAFWDDARVCLLDPSRPAPDLLEDLLSAIRGCYLLWREYAWDEEEPEMGQPETDEDEEEDESRHAAREGRLQQKYLTAVAAAMNGVDRLSI